MSRWWRAYDEAVDDPKLIQLGDKLGWAWFRLMCVASKYRGVLPPIETVAVHLRMSKHKAAETLTALSMAGLFDKRDDGSFEPHNWKGRQYQSDSSADRVKRHRERRVAAGLEPQWSAPKALRQAVYERDKFRCIYCGSTENLSLDHRTPERRGGTHEIENLATACMSCNGAKRDMTEEEFRSRNDLSNVSMPLPKRPQSTEDRTEQKKDAPSAPSNPEKELFDRGKQVLGNGAGGLIAKLLKAKDGNIALARAAIEQASQKSNPREYVGGVIAAKPREGEFVWKSGIPGVL